MVAVRAEPSSQSIPYGLRMGAGRFQLRMDDLDAPGFNTRDATYKNHRSGRFAERSHNAWRTHRSIGCVHFMPARFACLLAFGTWWIRVRFLILHDGSNAGSSEFDPGLPAPDCNVFGRAVVRREPAPPCIRNSSGDGAGLRVPPRHGDPRYGDADRCGVV